MTFASISQPLRYFRAVAEAGSFRKAGEQIGIAPSAINRQITLLEADLKVRLFERRQGRNQLRLTSAGEILLHRVQTSMHELNVGIQLIEALKGMRTGSISIGANDSLAKDLLPDLIKEFHRRHENINFNVTVGNTPMLLELAEQNKFDIVMANNLPARESLEPIATFQMGFCVFVATSHPLAGRKELRLSDCIDYPWAVSDGSMFLQSIQERLRERLGYDIRKIIVSNSFEFIRDMVRSGVAISIQSQPLFPRDVTEGRYVVIPLKDMSPTRYALSFCVNAGRDLPPLIEAFVQLLRNRIETLAHEPENIQGAWGGAP